MPKDKNRWHCSDGQRGPGKPGKGAMEMSEEARNILRKAAVPTEFNKVVGEMMPRPGTPSFHGPDRPSILPDTQGDPRLISPDALHKCPEERSLPSPVSDLPRYLPDSRIDATGMHHRTPALQQFVDLPLGRLGLITGNPSASMGPSRPEPGVPFGEIRPWPPPPGRLPVHSDAAQYGVTRNHLLEGSRIRLVRSPGGTANLRCVSRPFACGRCGERSPGRVDQSFRHGLSKCRFGSWTQRCIVEVLGLLRSVTLWRS
jgi:hypothetical protein